MGLSPEAEAPGPQLLTNTAPHGVRPTVVALWEQGLFASTETGAGTRLMDHIEALCSAPSTE